MALTLGIAATACLVACTGHNSTSVEAPVGAQSASENGTYAVDKSMISSQLGMAIRGNGFPETYDMNVNGSTKHVHVTYSLDKIAQEKTEKLIHRYSPDYAAFVAMDAKTGRILSMVSFSTKAPNSQNLALQATFPTASIFKVVTASAAIDLNKAAPETVVPFNGAYHTLYRRNVAETKITRWTRFMTMREAFARSVNTFFGKLGVFYVGPDNLLRYAERFLFNQPIRADVPVQIGYVRFSSEDPWSVATAASGFTRDNTMSPLQGALIASAVANDGVMMEPYLIESLVDDSGETLYRVEPRKESVVVEPKSDVELRELFRQTVRSGTSRKAFRDAVRRTASDDEIEFGGKTGSLTGLDPKGKCDWFVGYVRFHDERIAVAALTVNEKKWKVKSAMLAKLFFTDYLKELKGRKQ